MIQNDGHSPVQSSEPSQSFTCNFGSLSRTNFCLRHQKLHKKLTVHSIKEAIKKGQKTEKGVESRACYAMLDTLCLEQKIWLPWNRDVTL